MPIPYPTGQNAPLLPTNPGPVEPPILTGAGGGYPPDDGRLDAFTLGNGTMPQPWQGQWDPSYFTQMDPNMGYLNPSVQISGAPNESGGLQGSGAPSSTGENMWTRTPIGGLSHGMASLGRGTFMTDTPLGRLLGKMGFGKSGTVGGPAHVAGGAQPGGGAPAGPAWFQPGYRLPPGIQSAIASGDYGSAYGQAPPSADRFAQNSGTGNWQADQATKAFQLSGGYPGPANHPGVSDRGHDRFYGGPAMTADDQGGFAAADQSGDPAAAAATTAGAAARYQAALKAVPMGPGGYTAGYAQQLNDWIAQNGGGASTVTGTPNVTTPYSFLSLLNKPPFAGGPASGGARGPISISPPPIAGA